MFWISALLGTLAVVAGIRHVSRVRSLRGRHGPPRVDDEALRRILEHGSLPSGEDEPLDLEEAARAEEEFWSDSWDEPEEYGR